VIGSLGRAPWQRTTLYREAPPDRIAASFGAPPLSPTVETPVRKGTSSEWRMANSE
jgi:hypothetical protein